MGGSVSRWRRATQKIGCPCASLAGDSSPCLNKSTILISVDSKSSSEKIKGEENYSLGLKQNVCTICLEPLVFNEPGHCSLPATFTGRCSHSFHLACIASNIQHGSSTCPICRSYWPHLPDALLGATRRRPPQFASSDPILRILDDSIAASRVNRRFSLRSTRYNDDEPTDPNAGSLAPHHSRLRLSVSSDLCVSLAPLPVDLVLVVAPNGSHLRLLKRAIALAVFSLTSVDRLALVTCSPAAATRAFAFHLMSSCGKRAALQVADRLFCSGGTDSTEGLRKAGRILEDRVYRNPLSCILHLSDSPVARSPDQNLPMNIHWFHLGFGFQASSGFVMHEFEEFLGTVLGRGVRDVHLRVGKERLTVAIDDLRFSEERRIPMNLSKDSDFVYISYEYKEYGDDNTKISGGTVLEIGKNGDSKDAGGGTGPRRSRGGERWDYLDPFVARRWAKHLHGGRA